MAFGTYEAYDSGSALTRVRAEVDVRTIGGRPNGAGTVRGAWFNTLDVGLSPCGRPTTLGLTDQTVAAYVNYTGPYRPSPVNVPRDLTVYEVCSTSTTGLSCTSGSTVRPIRAVVRGRFGAAWTTQQPAGDPRDPGAPRWSTPGLQVSCRSAITSISSRSRAAGSTGAPWAAQAIYT